jgi:hypothetical protein
MRTLNDMPEEDNPQSVPAWTPALGLMHGAAWGLVTCLVLIAILTPLAWYVPLMVLQWLLRAAIGFGSAWILFGVIQRKAGFAGWAVTGLAVAYALLVLFSHHVIFAIHGIQWHTGVLTGLGLLAPPVMIAQDLTALGAVGVCAALRHTGSAGGGTLLDILMQSVWGSAR